MITLGPPARVAQTWSDSDHSRTRCWANLGRRWPSSAPTRATLVNIWPISGQTQLIPGPAWPNLVDLGTSLAEFGRSLADSGVKFGRFRANSGWIWSMSAQNWSTLANTWQNGQRLAEFEPTCADMRRIRPHSCKFDWRWPDLGKTRPAFQELTRPLSGTLIEQRSVLLVCAIPGLIVSNG